MPPPEPPDDATDISELSTVAIPARVAATSDRVASRSSRRARVGVVHADAPGLSAETLELKQRRLRAATAFFIMTLACFLLWRLGFATGTRLWPFHVCVLAAMGSIYALLHDPRPLPPAWLVALEVATFGIMATFLAVRQYDAMVSASLTEQVRAVQVAAKNTMIGTIILIFAYAMLIPNPWRRAARFVLALILVPLTTQTIVYAIHPEVFRLARRDSDASILAENVMFASIAAGLAIYGTRVINGLRVEAYEARRLNQYKLGAHLGSGGMGEVFEAEHTLLKRPCAIKLIKPERASDATALARFEREVRATAKLSHPNTIEIYDFGHTDRGTFYYVMELLRGSSLEELVGRHGPMSAGRVVRLLKPTAEALAEAHEAGMIHRDLKPANIFSAHRGGRYDVAKLLDFGLVKGGEDPGAPALSSEGTVRGTPHFMAPEQATGDACLDARCDLYALGGVAYFLLTGRPPFDGDNAARVMIAQVRDPVVPPSRVRPDGVPDDLEAVILRCLQKRREDRFPDARTLAAALGDCRCSGDWDDRAAEAWWDQHPPTSTSRETAATDHAAGLPP